VQCLEDAKREAWEGDGGGREEFGCLGKGKKEEEKKERSDSCFKRGPAGELLSNLQEAWN
jgi:hypothetical protein